MRQEGEWNDGYIEGASRHFVPQLLNEDLPFGHDAPIAVYCGSGYRASIAASILQSRGFSHVSIIPGGIKAWKCAGFEVIKEENK